MTTVSALWRHPIKSHGRECVTRAALVPGQAFPWDRHWAVSHSKSKFAGEWVGCGSFGRGSKTPALAGIWAGLDTETATVTLRHRDRDDISFCPDDPADAARFLAWLAPLYESGNQDAAAVVRIGTRGMTDSDFPSISIANAASHAAVSAQLGGALEPERWRANIWLEDLAPWQENHWIGKRLRIGGATLAVRERIVRCNHTTVNPVTGLSDADTLGTLRQHFGHQDFGIYAEVVGGGEIAVGDTCEVL